MSEVLYNYDEALTDIAHPLTSVFEYIGRFLDHNTELHELLQDNFAYSLIEIWRRQIFSLTLTFLSDS